MQFDFSEFNEQFTDLELDNIGEWPIIPKVVLAIFIGIMVIVLGYVALVSDKISKLENVQAAELTLRGEYKTKYNISANLELFQDQMKQAENLFAKQLKSLPESHETPGLIDDITFVGTTSGLDFAKLNWQPEIKKEIYIELPIDIEVQGVYHEFGNFVSKIAGLPRIVTVHDFEIQFPNSRDQDSKSLSLKLQAKTYRYSEAEK